jgi:hypothetical protein
MLAGMHTRYNRFVQPQGDESDGLLDFMNR